MLATVYLVAFISGIGSGHIAGYYEATGATDFWIMTSLISLSGACAVLLFGPALKQAMHRLDKPGFGH